MRDARDNELFIYSFFLWRDRRHTISSFYYCDYNALSPFVFIFMLSSWTKGLMAYNVAGCVFVFLP